MVDYDEIRRLNRVLKEQEAEEARVELAIKNAFRHTIAPVFGTVLKGFSDFDRRLKIKSGGDLGPLTLSLPLKHRGLEARITASRRGPGIALVTSITTPNADDPHLMGKSDAPPSFATAADVTVDAVERQVMEFLRFAIEGYAGVQRARIDRLRARLVALFEAESDVPRETVASTFEQWMREEGLNVRVVARPGEPVLDVTMLDDAGDEVPGAYAIRFAHNDEGRLEVLIERD